MPGELSQDLDMHHLEAPLPLESQEEITVGSRRKGEALGQMQPSRFPRRPGQQERAKKMRLLECPQNPDAVC